MIKSNQKFLNFLHMISDSFLVFLSFQLSYLLYFSYLPKENGVTSFWYYLVSGIIAVIYSTFLYDGFGIY